MMNRLLTLLLAASCLTAVGQVDLTEGLFAWYTFEGNTDNGLAPEEPELVSDVEFVLGEDGLNELGIFNGATSKIEIQSENPQFCLDQDFTISFKAKLNPNAGYQPIISRTRISLQTTGYNIGVLGSDLKVALNNDPPNGCGSACNWGTTVPISLTEELKHIVLTRSDNTLSVYVDGDIVHVDTIELASGGELICSSTQKMFLGHDVVYNTFLDGVLDDVALWNRGLSSEEVMLISEQLGMLLGCTDEDACNFNIDALVHDQSCEGAGCTDSYACNFDFTAACDDGNCDYNCCPGPGCCLDGQHWDWELNGCVITNPADINLDGCVQLNDLLDLLSAYGNCAAEESAWQCGDPLEYQGYNYEIVQIGEQCWFAENLRNEHYQNGDTIPASLSDSDWGSTSSGAVAVYEENPSNVEVYGRLYNWHAVDDARGLCPSGWHVPTDEEWITMEIALGLSESEANGMGFRGTDQGDQLKASPSDSPSWNGSNSSGFSGLPGGYRWTSPSFGDIGIDGIWWSSTPTNQSAWVRYLRNSTAKSGRYPSDHNYGFSVRCIKDSE